MAEGHPTAPRELRIRAKPVSKVDPAAKTPSERFRIDGFCYSVRRWIVAERYQ